MARYASYEILAGIIRQQFANPVETLQELFSRLALNILCGSTDNHACNHAAFWDGRRLTLTPAYDSCPQGRAGNQAPQAMLISSNNNLSQLKVCLAAAHHFLIKASDTRSFFERQNAIFESIYVTATTYYSCNRDLLRHKSRSFIEIGC